MWWKTKCGYCGKPIEVKIPLRLIMRNRDLLKGNTCYRCIPASSILRNGIDEDAWETRAMEEYKPKHLALCPPKKHCPPAPTLHNGACDSTFGRRNCNIMSDILIRGMELPNRNTVYSVLLRVNADGTAQLQGSYADDFGSYEAIPLPPHGRLIEADDLYESCALDPCIDVIASAKRINEYMQLKIDDTPTIIPASE